MLDLCLTLNLLITVTAHEHLPFIKNGEVVLMTKLGWKSWMTLMVQHLVLGIKMLDHDPISFTVIQADGHCAKPVSSFIQIIKHKGVRTTNFFKLAWVTHDLVFDFAASSALTRIKTWG